MIDNLDVTLLDTSEIIFEFNDKYPGSLFKRDSLLFVIQIKSDTCLSVINLNNKEIICSFGTVGHGENDMLNPNFILTLGNENLLLDVGNLRRIVRVGNVCEDSVNMINIEYPDSIFISSELNLSDNYIVGRKVDAYDKDMFFVYDRKTNTKLSVPCFPSIQSPIKDYNYTYAPVLALNELKGRIIAGMYFFNMFHVYDLFGNRLNTFKFSNDCYPTIERKSGLIDFSKGYNGIVRAFPTQDYCYLLRMLNKRMNKSTQYMLMKIDWNGKVKGNYIFKDNVLGQFCVDEEENKLYIIKNHIEETGEEIFSVVSYDLNHNNYAFE